jgi:hypothetical protein
MIANVGVLMLNLTFAAFCGMALVQSLLKERCAARLLWGAFFVLTEGFASTGRVSVAVLVLSGLLGMIGGAGVALRGSFSWARLAALGSKLNPSKRSPVASS